MTAMMLTALDANTGSILNVTLMSDEQRDQVHGRDTRRRHGYETICKECHGGVHLVRYHRHETVFWRHNPFGRTACITSQFHTNESPEHLAAKVAVFSAMNDLKGWDVTPEKYFDNGNDIAKIDVYAEHSEPTTQRKSYAWEVQLSHLTHGTFTERTDRIRRLAGIEASWITPFDNECDKHQALVTDPAADLVVARMYTEPDESSPPLPPRPLGRVIKDLCSHRPTLTWSQSGEDGRFIIFPKDSIGNTPTRPTPTPQLGTTEPEDRPCDRPPIQPRSRAEPTRELTADHCPRCGLSIPGIERFWQLGLRVRPCNRCPDEIRHAHTQVWLLA